MTARAPTRGSVGAARAICSARVEGVRPMEARLKHPRRIGVTRRGRPLRPSVKAIGFFDAVHRSAGTPLCLEASLLCSAPRFFGTVDPLRRFRLTVRCGANSETDFSSGGERIFLVASTALVEEPQSGVRDHVLRPPRTASSLTVAERSAQAHREATGASRFPGDRVSVRAVLHEVAAGPGWSGVTDRDRAVVAGHDAERVLGTHRDR